MILKLKNSDFVMAKRLKRQQNKDQAGCMSGIVSIFDFRHGRITRRLPSDNRAHMTESTTGPSCPTSEVNSLMDSEEMQQQIESPTNENSEMELTRVKELMEEEMQCDQTEKTLSRSFNSREITIDQQIPSQRTSQYRDLEDLMNKLLLIHEKRNKEQIPQSLERSNSLDYEQNNSRLEEPITRKNQNLFRRRSKSHECILLNENDTPLPSNTTNGFKFRHERSASQFSFTEIKKKLKNAIGKSSRESGYQEKPVVDGNNGWSSPNRDHFYSERFSRISNGFIRQEGVSRLCKSERKSSENNEFGDISDRISNIYVEAKKHLSEMLNNGDEVTEPMVESHSRTLGKLLSFPGYNSLSPDLGRKNKPMVNESRTSVTCDDHQEPEVSDEVHQAKGFEEIIKPPPPEKIEAFDASDLNEKYELSCSPIASPSRSSLAFSGKTEETETTSDDRTGKPSPVSVLEPLFSDDDISPARPIPPFAESSIQPLRLRFEETDTPIKNQETCILKHVENEESVFEYIEAVLLACDLNWDEFEQRWLSSAQILDPSLYHELQIFSSRPRHDQRLLFDTTNEILKEVCDRSLGFFPEVSYLNQNIHPFPKGMNLINEVWERIESRLNCHYPRSLDQLIKKHFEVSRTWIDLCSETSELVMEFEESMFEDMIDDTVLSLMHD